MYSMTDTVEYSMNILFPIPYYSDKFAKHTSSDSISQDLEEYLGAVGFISKTFHRSIREICFRTLMEYTSSTESGFLKITVSNHTDGFSEVDRISQMAQVMLFIANELENLAKKFDQNDEIPIFRTEEIMLIP